MSNERDEEVPHLKSEDFRRLGHSISSTGGGVIQGTASEATLVAMVAARARVRRKRSGEAPLVGYSSTQAHSSVLKAAMLSGVARDASDTTHLRLLETDSNYALRPEALERAITEDLAAGRQPFFVCATLGTTSSGAVDPLGRVGEVMERTGLTAMGGWLHVDAAWAGAALVCPENQTLAQGLEAVDSLAFDPHNASGSAFLSHTVLPGVGGAPARYVLRLAIGSPRTEERHVLACWELLQRLAQEASKALQRG